MGNVRVNKVFRGVCAGALGMLGLAAADAPHWTKAPPSPQASARFLPAHVRIDDSAQARKVRELLSRLPTDSTRHWSWSGNCLDISHALLMDLLAGEPEAAWRQRPADRLAGFLRRKYGVGPAANRPAYGDFVPDDSLYPIGPQWALNNPGVAMGATPAKAGVDINMQKVWDKFSGADSLVIAVVDAGFNFAHPDLKGRHWVNLKELNGKPGVDDDGNGFVDDSVGWDFVDNDNRPDDFNGHGTFTSSVIAANLDNHEGIAGMLAQGKIMPVRVLDASGHGDIDVIAKGIRYAVDNGAKVINFSIGGGGDDTAMRNAFQYARDKGVPIVAAAGNEAMNLDATPAFPSNYGFENLFVVSSHSPTAGLSVFSNYGATTAHLAAPGELILVCGVPDRKEIWTEKFESGLGNWSVTGMGLSADKPLEGAQSLVWTSGNSAQAATAGYIDLTGISGATLSFHLEYQPASASDALVVQGNREGTSTWDDIAGFAEPVTGNALMDFGLEPYDRGRFKLRFITQLSRFQSSAGRAVKIDDIVITYPDPNPPTQANYTVVGGTSLSAPHVTAYVGLLRLACDRMGVPFTRDLALQGTVPEPALAGKMTTGGRLDVFKGLSFYLSGLPSLRVRDSTVVSWHEGDAVEYSLDVFPAPAQPYQLTESGLGPDAHLDSATGKLTWIPRQTGTFTLSLVATGPTVLRKKLTLKVQAGIPVGFRLADGGARLWHFGNQTFRVPKTVPDGALLEITGLDALGRSRSLKREVFNARLLGAAPEVPEAFAFTHLRVRLNGLDLPEAR